MEFRTLQVAHARVSQRACLALPAPDARRVDNSCLRFPPWWDSESAVQQAMTGGHGQSTPSPDQCREASNSSFLNSQGTILSIYFSRSNFPKPASSMLLSHVHPIARPTLLVPGSVLLHTPDRARSPDCRSPRRVRLRLEASFLLQVPIVFLPLLFVLVPCPKSSGSSCCSWYHTRSQFFVDPFPHVHVPEFCCFTDDVNSSHTLSSSSSFILASFLFRLTRSVPKYFHVVCPTESFCVRETYAAP